MVPLQATFALVTEPALRGRIFSLAGLGVDRGRGPVVPRRRLARQAHEPLPGVAICAAVCLVLIAVLAMTWPHRRVRTAVDRAYASTSSSRAA